MAQTTLIDIFTQIFGEIPYGYEAFVYILGGLLLFMVFHILEEIFNVLFSRFLHY